MTATLVEQAALWRRIIGTQLLAYRASRGHNDTLGTDAESNLIAGGERQDPDPFTPRVTPTGASATGILAATPKQPPCGLSRISATSSYHLEKRVTTRPVLTTRTLNFDSRIFVRSGPLTPQQIHP